MAYPLRILLSLLSSFPFLLFLLPVGEWRVASRYISSSLRGTPVSLDVSVRYIKFYVLIFGWFLQILPTFQTAMGAERVTCVISTYSAGWLVCHSYLAYRMGARRCAPVVLRISSPGRSLQRHRHSRTLSIVMCTPAPDCTIFWRSSAMYFTIWGNMTAKVSLVSYERCWCVSPAVYSIVHVWRCKPRPCLTLGGRRIVNTTQLIRKKGVYSNMYKTTCFGQQWPSSGLLPI